MGCPQIGRRLVFREGDFFASLVGPAKFIPISSHRLRKLPPFNDYPALPRRYGSRRVPGNFGRKGRGDCPVGREPGGGKGWWHGCSH